MTTTKMLQDIIVARRDALVRQTDELIDQWFHPQGRRPFRSYAPSLRKKPSPGSGLSVSLYWTYRRPIASGQGVMMRQGRGGALKLTKVVAQYVAPRRTGQPYPPGAFPRASAEECAEIMAAESQLSPIRKELKILGRLLLSVHAYARQMESAEGRVHNQADNQAAVDDWDDFDPYDQ